MTVKISKVVSSLPGTLEADTLYFVRVGAGFKLYVTDSSGTVAYYHNDTENLTDLLDRWGSTGAVIPNDNIDDITLPGSYFITNAVVSGSPSLSGITVASGSNLLQFQYNSDNATQILVTHPGANTFVRIKDSGAWSNFEKLGAEADLLRRDELQPDRYDSGFGQVLVTGSFGLGLAPGAYPNEYDFDNFSNNPTGFYWYNNTGDLGPSGYGAVIAVNYAGTSQMRLAFNPSGTEMYFNRIDSVGNESAWNSVWHSGNLVLQTNSMDATVGSVLKQGAGGLLGATPTYSGDFDNAQLGSHLTSGQINDTQAAAVNLPDLGNGTNSNRWWIVHTFGTATRTVQTATEVFGAGESGGSYQAGAGGRTFTRTRHDTTWDNWLEVVTQAPSVDYVDVFNTAVANQI